MTYKFYDNEGYTLSGVLFRGETPIGSTDSEGIWSYSGNVSGVSFRVIGYEPIALSEGIFNYYASPKAYETQGVEVVARRSYLYLFVFLIIVLIMSKN